MSALGLFNPIAMASRLVEAVRLLIRHRSLALEMTRREISDQYAGQILGRFWAVGHPLFVMALYIFVFAVVFKIRLPDTSDLPLDYTVYILSGLIPWLGFQQGMARACTAFTSQANLVKQIVFPIEILPVRTVLASIVTQLIATLALVVYVASTAEAVPATYLLLPVLLAVQILAMFGIAFILATVGVFLRDLKDLVQLFLTAGIYLMPVVYLPDWVPAVLRPLLYANPFSYMVWCYQDALYFGRVAHPWAWVVFLGGSLFVFATGYRLFRRLKPYFGNLL